MRNGKLILLVTVSFLLLGGLHAGKNEHGLVYQGDEYKDDFCGIRNFAFGDNEILNFSVYYSVIGLYVNAATADVVINLEKLNNRPVYHVVGIGKTNSSYDWITRVNNRYETYIDTANLQPLKFQRKVEEGNHRKTETITFNKTANTAITNDGVYKVPPCVQDVVSALCYARNINFDKYKPGDKISFKMFIENELFDMYIRYVGKETIRTRYGKFRTIRIKPLLIKGTVFEGGEKMNVWVSDDRNRIPVRVETPLTVGSVKADMMGYKNLRYPLTSLRNLR